MRNIGSSIGISIVMSRLMRGAQANHAELVSHVTPFNRLFDAPSVAQFWDPSTAAGQAALNAEITRQATMMAYIDDFWLMTAMTLLTVPLVLLLRRPRDAAAPATATPE